MRLDTSATLAPGRSRGNKALVRNSGARGPIPHPLDESFYVIRGEFDFSVNRSDLRSARPGDLVHVPAGTPHWFH